MQINIQTDSKKVYNALTSTIWRMKTSQQDSHANGKYVYFKCKTDFIEALYMMAICSTETNVDLDKKRTENDLEYTITTGSSLEKKKKYNWTAYMHDDFFIYND